MPDVKQQLLFGLDPSVPPSPVKTPLGNNHGWYGIMLSNRPHATAPHVLPQPMIRYSVPNSGDRHNERWPSLFLLSPPFMERMRVANRQNLPVLDAALAQRSRTWPVEGRFLRRSRI